MELEVAMYSWTEYPEDITAEERETLASAINAETEIRSELLRGLNGDFSGISIGDTITMDGLTSWTDDFDIAAKFARGKSRDKADRFNGGAVFILSNATGLAVTGRYSDEAEYLRNGGAYVVTSIDYDSDYDVYIFEVSI